VWRVIDATATDRIRIARGLLELQRRGNLPGLLYIDEDRITLRRGGEIIRHLSWHQAHVLVGPEQINIKFRAGPPRAEPWQKRRAAYLQDSVFRVL
jgi:hypothetical protein